MEVVAMDHGEMSWKVRVLALVGDGALASKNLVPVQKFLPHDVHTLDPHNSESAIVHHYLFLRCYNMDPRWNCLGYQSILGIWMVAAMMIVASESLLFALYNPQHANDANDDNCGGFL